MYKLCVWLVKLFYLPFIGLKINGKENLDNIAGSIVYSNHLSAGDIIVLQALTKVKLKVMAKEELFKNKLIGAFMRMLGAFPTSRGKNDWSALETAEDALAGGSTFMIFPEGTRSKTGKLGRFMPGLASIALDTGAPLVMVTIKGKPRYFGKTEFTFHEKKKVTDYVESEEHSMRNIKKLTDALREEMAEELQNG